MRLRAAIAGLGLILAACGSSSGASAGANVTLPPAASAAVSAAASAAAELADDAKAWCTNHLGGPGADQHQVEDAAIKLGLIPGATTRDAVFGRWAGKSAADLLEDPTYVAACTAAFAQQAIASPSG